MVDACVVKGLQFAAKGASSSPGNTPPSPSYLGGKGGTRSSIEADLSDLFKSTEIVTGKKQEDKFPTSPETFDLVLSDREREKGRDWCVLFEVDATIGQHPSEFEEYIGKGGLTRSSVSIVKDVSRTFSHVALFKSYAGQRNLLHVLLALAAYFPSIGYCQGLNYVVGTAVQLLQPENAFWFLVNMLDRLHMVSLWEKGLPLVNKLHYVFTRLLAQHDCVLAEHFDGGVGRQWFLTLFSADLPLPLVLWLWDQFFLKGQAVLLQASVSLLVMNRAALLSVSPCEAHSVVASFSQTVTATDLLASMQRVTLEEIASFEAEFYSSHPHSTLPKFERTGLSCEV